MRRLSFARLAVATALVFCPGSLMAQAKGAVQEQDNEEGKTDVLLSQFRDPGAEARPRVWWHWMNGNVSWDGVRQDMDWMSRIGIAGLQAFDAGGATPQLVKTRLPYMSPGWKQVFRKTAAYADKRGLELAIAASPGWSETGGPWVTAPDAMKKMAWSVTRVSAPSGVVHLAQPPRTSGIFQTSDRGWALGGRAPGQEPPEYYVDQKVIAFPLAAGAHLPRPTITSSGGHVDAAALGDGDLKASGVDLPAGRETGAESWIQFDYGRPVVVRGLTFATPVTALVFDGLAGRKNGPAPTGYRLDVSEDGQHWTDTRTKIQSGLPQRTMSVNDAKGRYFRFVSIRQPPDPPRRVPRFGRPSAPPPEVLPIAELRLQGEPTVHSFEDKAAFVSNGDYYALPSGSGSAIAPKTTDILDLTTKMAPDGTLDWTPPPGDWDVLRIGYSLTGAMNRPASPEATGLEVDKLDAAAVRRYMDHYFAMYRDATGGLMGKHGLRAMVFDSWEASHANWTPRILDEFLKLRGYDPTPWLPALAGYVVDSADRTDAFLWDWRRTLQQLLKANHYDQLTGMLHDVGMVRYGEAHEGIYATMGDGMEMKQSADIPMGAMWQADIAGEIETGYFNDLQESASVAHIYGQNIVTAEALTGGPRFGSAPWDLKPTADAILLAGANRFAIHTSTHQPISRGPGLTLGPGQYFTRNETWAEQAGPWINYLSRASYLLQQGRAANDLAIFYGEADPVIASYRFGYPAVPVGYRYDYVNADVILNRLSPKDGMLVTKTGMQYKAIMMGRGTQKVSLPVLEKLMTMVEAGATLIGERPAGSPSLSDDPVRTKAVLDLLWPGSAVAQVGLGRVFAAADAAGALSAIALAPDFRFEKPRPDSDIMFIHRRLDDGDLYFLSNRVDRAETISASFRVSGKVPELWDASTGEVRPASYAIIDGRTKVEIPFDRFGSIFVVFRKTADRLEQRIVSSRTDKIADVRGPWTLAFQSRRGAPAKAIFPELKDFRENGDPGIRYFSGLASYTQTLDVSQEGIADARRTGSKLWLDLGIVHDLAEIWINGKLAGTAWKPPYRVDVTSFLRPGRNRVEIKAVNLWVNRLIGDVQPGVTRKISFTAADGMPRADVSPERTAMEMRMPYPPDAPLKPSGLTGPVSLLRETAQ